MEKMRLRGKIGLSTVAIVTGLTLCILHLTLPGLFVLGAGLYFVAPSYVRENIEAFRGGNKEDNG
jgi:hypothetical protein